MKARRDFLDEAEYADYLKTYATIAAMQGILANSNTDKYMVNDGYLSAQPLVNDAACIGDALVAELYK